MLIDATCASADIRHPTNLSLLNEGLELTEKLLELLFVFFYGLATTSSGQGMRSEYSHCAAEASDSLSMMIGLRAQPRSTFVEAAPRFTFTGGPIYAQGYLEALYIGGDLNASQPKAMVSGDNSQGAIDNTIFSYGNTWG